MSKILNSVALSDFSSYKIGGPAKYFAEVGSTDDLVSVLKQWREISKDSKENGKDLPRFGGIFVLGGGTNVLVNDNGYDGLVILNKIKYIRVEDSRITVGSGVSIEDLLNFCIENSLSSLEWAGGLPGTIGGAVRGNAGAFGGEIKDVVLQILSLDTETPEIKKRNNTECDFGYRNSFFKINPNEIIIEVVLSLKKGNKDKIENQINEKIDYRKRKHPSIHKEPNIGSTFKNIPVENLQESVVEEFKDKIKTDPFPVLPATKLIAGAGMSGERVGDIVVSQMHPNYLVNTGHGKSSDVLSLIKKIKKAVREKYEVELEEEITII